MNVKRLNQGESHLADKSRFGRLTNVPFMSRVELKAKIVSLSPNKKQANKKGPIRIKDERRKHQTCLVDRDTTRDESRNNSFQKLYSSKSMVPPVKKINPRE